MLELIAVVTDADPRACLFPQQPGLISRVTDTVKSIVPSWLQKYFRNGEVAEGGETHVQVEQNNVPTPPNGSQEDGRNQSDGRNSPEPSTSNAGTVLHACVSKKVLMFHRDVSQYFWLFYLPAPFYAVIPPSLTQNPRQAEHR